MITKLTATLAAAAFLAVTLIAFTYDADAQPCSYADAVVHCAAAVPYPGPFTDEQEPEPLFGFGDEIGTAVVVTAPEAAPELAVTGSGSALGFVGAGLIGAGALALAARRKFD